MRIRNWDEIKDQFDNAAIILGNGASIAFDNKFHYQSLLAEARTAQFITTEVQKIFDQFSISDFEQVLLRLWQASQINKILKQNNNAIDIAYNNVKSALINVVRHIHGSFQEWNTQTGFSTSLIRAATFLKDFHTIISLNYDCLVYWIILKGKYPPIQPPTIQPT